jgi:uncharacterized membrane protein YfcA
MICSGALDADCRSALMLTLIALTLLLAGTVKGLFGLGLPTVTMGLLGLIMPPVQAAALLVVPTLVTNAWQLAGGPALRAVVSRFSSMILPFGVGTLLGIRLLTADSPTLAPALLGIVLVLYALMGLSSRQWVVPPRRERWLSPLIALCTGVLNGATGISAIPLARLGRVVSGAFFLLMKTMQPAQVSVDCADFDTSTYLVLCAAAAAAVPVQ